MMIGIYGFLGDLLRMLIFSLNSVKCVSKLNENDFKNFIKRYVIIGEKIKLEYHLLLF